MSYRGYTGNYGTLGGYGSTSSYGSLGRSGRGYGTLSDAGSTRSYSSSKNYGGSYSNLPGRGTSGNYSFESSPWRSSSYSGGINKERGYSSADRSHAGRDRSGYMSDYGGSTRSISSRSDRFRTIREKSPVRSYRPSRTEPRYRNTSSSLTPFESRRSRTTDPTVSPSQINRSRSYEPAYQRKSVSHSVSSLAAKFDRQPSREEPRERIRSSDRYSRYSDRQSRLSDRQSRESLISNCTASDRQSRENLTSHVSSDRRNRDTLATPSFSRQSSRGSLTSQDDVFVPTMSVRERRHAREAREREAMAKSPSEVPDRHLSRESLAASSAGRRERRLSRESQSLQQSRESVSTPSIGVRERRLSRESQRLQQSESMPYTSIGVRERRLSRESQEAASSPYMGVRERRLSKESLQQSNESLNTSSTGLRERRLAREKQASDQSKESLNTPSMGLRERRLMREKQVIPVIEIQSGSSTRDRERHLSRETQEIPVISGSSKRDRERRSVREKQEMPVIDVISGSPINERERRPKREKEEMQVIDVVSGTSMGAREYRLAKEKQELDQPVKTPSMRARERRLAREKQAIPVIDVCSGSLETPPVQRPPSYPSQDHHEQRESVYSRNQKSSRRRAQDTSDSYYRYLETSRQYTKESYDKDSSESVSEQELLDADVRFLTSRGTCTGDSDSDLMRSSRRSKKSSISRTKTKKYPKRVYSRVRDRPLLIDCASQVNREQLRHFRRLVWYGSKSSLFLPQSETPRSPSIKKESQDAGSSRYQRLKEERIAIEKAQAQKSLNAERPPRENRKTKNREEKSPGARYSKQAETERSEEPLSPSVPENVETRRTGRTKRSETHEQQQQQLSVPHSSAPRSSPSRFSLKELRKMKESGALSQQSQYHPQRRSNRAGDISGMEDADETDEDIESASMAGPAYDSHADGIVIPRSLFISSERKRREEELVRVTEQERKQAAPVAALTPENLSLKDSIEKVKSWKKQLQISPPDTPVSPTGVFVSSEPQVDVNEAEPKKRGRGHTRTGSDSSKQSDKVKSKRAPRTSSNEDGHNKNRRRSKSRPRRDSSGSKKSIDLEEEENIEYRKSELNKWDPTSERNPEVLASRRNHRRHSSAGSSSDAFSRDHSPNRLRQTIRQESFEKQTARKSSKDDILPEKQDSPDEEPWIQQVQDKYTIKRQASTESKRDSRPRSIDKKDRKKIQRQKSKERRLAGQMMTPPVSRQTSIEQERRDSDSDLVFNREVSQEKEAKPTEVYVHPSDRQKYDAPTEFHSVEHVFDTDEEDEYIQTQMINGTAISPYDYEIIENERNLIPSHYANMSKKKKVPTATLR